MKLQDLQKYIDSLVNDGLTKISVELEIDAETTDNTFYVIKTKETFVYGDEQEADAKIDDVRQINGFAGCDKKFKAGKISKKTGEELTPDTYTVVVKLNH